MTELVARIVAEGEERHLVLVEDGDADTGEPWTLFVNASHYDAHRRTLERAYYWSLASARADCHDRFGVGPEDWVAADAVRFNHLFQFDYGLTNRGVPQPYPLGFAGAEILFALGQVEQEDGPPMPVLNVSGNADGLRRLAALLLLCAESERYDPRFHVHLSLTPSEPSERPFLVGDIDVTLRAPGYLADLKDGSLREWGADVDVDDRSDEGDEPWRARPET